MTRVGIIEIGQAEEAIIARYGTYSQMIEAYFTNIPNTTFSSFDALKSTALPSPQACDAWIIPGSRFSVCEEHSWLASLRSFARNAITSGTPILGICFGHQLMVQAMGGVVKKSPKGKGIGVHCYSLTEIGKELFAGKTEMNLIAAHEDQVVIAPPGSPLLATSSFCKFAAFSYGTAGLSLQSHPEFSIAYERDLIEGWNRRSPMGQALINAALETLNKIPPDSEFLAPILGRFLTRQPELELKHAS